MRIADFGMCKLQIYLDRTAESFCGTPDYMAPEIIKVGSYFSCLLLLRIVIKFFFSRCRVKSTTKRSIGGHLECSCMRCWSDRVPLVVATRTSCSGRFVMKFRGFQRICPKRLQISSRRWVPLLFLVFVSIYITNKMCLAVVGEGCKYTTRIGTQSAGRHSGSSVLPQYKLGQTGAERTGSTVQTGCGECLWYINIEGL